MAITRKHVQDSILKIDREIVELLKQRCEKVSQLADFDSDTTQAGKVLDNAVAAARKIKADPDFVNGMFHAINLKYGAYELDQRVTKSIKAWREDNAKS